MVSRNAMSEGTRWLRVVISPKYLLWAMLAYLVVCLPIVACWSLGLRAPVDSHLGAMIWLVALAGTYGVYRIWAFHPALLAHYRQWLSYTPWTPQLPLPLGPVHLVWQDLGFLVALQLLLLIHRTTMDAETLMTRQDLRASWTWMPWLPVFAFFLAQLVLIALVCVRTRLYDFAIGLFYGIGLIVLTLPRVPIASILSVAIYVVARVGLRRSLQVVWERFVSDENVTPTQADERSTLGWPYFGIGPYASVLWNPALPNVVDIPWKRYASLVAGLLGWWCFVILTTFARAEPSFDAEWERHPELTMLIVVGFAIVVAFARLIIYCFGYAPPISLLGRIRTRRWVIREHDVVYLSPLIILLINILLVILLLRSGIRPRWFVPGTMALTIWLSIVLGPSLQRWQLTGSHRLEPRAFKPLGKSEP